MVWADVPEELEDEYNRWYNQEHIADLLDIPGVLNAARYEAIRGGPKHLACYELENPGVVESDAFVNRKKTDWAERIGPTVISTTLINPVYEMVHPASVTPEIADSGMAPVLQVGRMSVPEDREDEWNQWYNTVFVPNFEKVPGVIRGRRWRAVRSGPKYAVVYEFEHEMVPESPEWATQRDIDPRNDPMRALITHGPGSPGVWKKTFEV
jgi:hypothetical protein